MVVKLTVEQISIMWPIIKYGVTIADNVPPGNELEYTNEVLKNLLAGTFQAWLGFEKEGDESKPYAFMLTRIAKDVLFGFNYLSLESLYGFRPVKDEILLQDWEVLKKFAKDTGCKLVRTRTRWGRVIQLCEASGFTDTKFKMFEYIV